MRLLLLAVTSVLVLACADAPECAAPPSGAEALGTPTSWERVWLAGGGLPASPDARFLQGEEGVGLAYREWVPSDWDGRGNVVLFVHGSSAHSGLYAALGEGLMARGVYARLIDLRGHGLSVCRASGDCSNPDSAPRRVGDDAVYYPGRVGDSHDKNQIIRDIAHHLSDLRSRWPEANTVHIAGHSSGGGVVSRFVEHGGLAHVDGVALIAPFNHADQPQNQLQTYDCGRIQGSTYAHVHMGALGDALRGNDHRYMLYFNKDEPYLDALDTLQNTWTTTQGMQVDDAERFHAAFTQPVLWIAAEHDALLDLEISRQEFERFPGGGAFVVALDTSHIGLSWSNTVAGVLADWIVEPNQVQSRDLAPP